MITIEDFILRTALYQPVPYSPDHDLPQLFELLYFNGTVDFYCTECDRDSTFKGENLLAFKWNNANRSFSTYDRVFEHFSTNRLKVLEQIKKDQIYHNVNLRCTRDGNHSAIVILELTSNSVSKVGQFPSIASQSLPNIKKYRAVLGNEKFKELKRAVGLFAHDVGVGAFVYLRRIFEDLINEAYQKAKESPSWLDDNFSGSI